MPLSAKTGTLTEPASTGTQAVTGLGFQPKVVLFFWSGSVNDNSNDADIAGGIGASADASNSYAASIAVDNASGVAVNGSRAMDDGCIAIPNFSGSALASRAAMSSLDAGGFTLNWTAVSGVNRIIKYLALGGTAIDAAKVVKVTSPTSTGSQGITGVGFQPTALLQFAATMAYTYNPVPSYTVNSDFTLGAASGSTSEWGFGYYDDDGPTTTNVTGIQSTSRIVDRVEGASYNRYADLTSFDADGFTLNWGAVTGFDDQFFFLCLKTNGPVKAGTFTKSASSGANAITGVGFQPEALFIASLFKTTADHTVINLGGSAEMPVHFGTASSTTAEQSTKWKDDDAASGSQATSRSRSGYIFDNSGLTGDLSAFGSDGFTITWSGAGSTERFFYLAFGTDNTAPTIIAGPTTTYASGTCTTPTVTWGVTFTATDSEQTGADALTYYIRTSSTFGAGTQVATGTCTSGASKVVTGLAYNASGVVEGTQTLYLHIYDGTLNTVTASSFTLRRRFIRSTAGTGGTLTGALSRAPVYGKAIAGAISSVSGALSRITNKSTSGVAGALAGSFAALRTFFKELSGGISNTSGSISKNTSKALSGATASISALLSKSTAKALSGAAGSVSATLSSIKVQFISLSGGITSVTGSLVANTTYARAIAGELLSLTGNVSRMTLKALSGASGAASGALSSTRLFSKAIAGEIATVSGSVTRFVTKSFSGTITGSGILSTASTFYRTVTGSLSSLSGAFSFKSIIRRTKIKGGSVVRSVIGGGSRRLR